MQTKEMDDESRLVARSKSSIRRPGDTRKAVSDPAISAPHISMLGLQRAAGNSAVTRALTGTRHEARIWSRRRKDLTDRFPDIATAAARQLPPKPSSTASW